MIRQKAGLSDVGRIDPRDVAKLAGEVEIFDSFSAFPLSSYAMEREVSALTVKIDETYYIVENDKHPSVRRRASIMEEFAHILLRHKPSTVSLDALSLMQHRTYNMVQEKEAYALGAATLVPYAELRRLVFDGGMPFAEAADYYEVSGELISYRLKTTYVWRELKITGRLEGVQRTVSGPQLSSR